MQITTIRYERLWNLGNYENEKFGAEAQVLRELKAFCENERATMLKERQEARRQPSEDLPF